LNEKGPRNADEMAGFPFIKTIDEFDFAFQRSITHKQVNQLLDMQWIEKFYNLIFLAPRGLAKPIWLQPSGLKP
jgi:DNA replication protein DnaC